MYKPFCDTCKKQLGKGRASCSDCGESSSFSDELHYHKACLKKINNGFYCSYHAGDHLEGSVILNYLKRTWQGLNLGGNLTIVGHLDDSDHWAVINIVFPNCTFTFRGHYDSYSKSLLFKNQHDQDVVTRVRLHHHAGFRKALKALIIAAVRYEFSRLEGSIKSREIGIRADQRQMKKVTKIQDVVLGKAKWPKPKPIESTTHEQIPLSGRQA